MHTLEKLYDNFYESSKQLSLQKKIDENHKSLISNLSKSYRKSVIRIIKAKDLIFGIHKRESFICGFKSPLALQFHLFLHLIPSNNIKHNKFNSPTNSRHILRRVPCAIYKYKSKGVV